MEGASEHEETVDSLREQLRVATQLIQKLEGVVVAQHHKIEEARSSKAAQIDEEQGCPKVQMHMLAELKKEGEVFREDRKLLEAKARRLAALVKQLRGNNAEQKRQLQRCADMLAQAGQAPAVPTLPLHSSLSTSPPTRIWSCSPTEVDGHVSRVSTINGKESKEPLEAEQPDLVDGLAAQRRSPRAGAAESRVGAADSPRRAQQTPHGPDERGARTYARVARATSALWREAGDPRILIHTLLHGAAQILEGPSSTPTLTLYISDPWLRALLAEGANDEVGNTSARRRLGAPTVFYLSGKVTLHAYRRDAGRPEPPCFPDLASLPVRRGPPAQLALPLQACVGRPVVAALQASAAGGPAPAQDEAERQPPLAAGRASARGRHIAALEGEYAAPVAPAAAAAAAGGVAVVSDPQATGLQLLCHTAAGILEARRQAESIRVLQRRARQCLSITAELHGAATLSDFEQRAKILMMRFFSVACARLSFYDPDSQMLITTAIRAHRFKGEADRDTGTEASRREPMPLVGRRNLKKCSIQEGIVGRCARRGQIFHLERITTSPYVNEAADGIDLGERAGDLNMLAGPMTADLTDGTSQMVGVLQLIEKRRRADDPAAMLEQHAGGGPGEKPKKLASCDEFTPEDEDFFQELLKILGLAAHRTMQVSSAGRVEPAQRGGGPGSRDAAIAFSVERLLSGPAHLA